MPIEDTALLPVLGSVGFRNWLNRFLLDPNTSPCLFPWMRNLDVEAQQELRRDLEFILSEPEESGEPLDVRELREILRDYAMTADWDGPLLCGPMPAEAMSYTVDIRPQELRLVQKAAPGVRRAVAELLEGFLASCPTDPSRLGTFKIKKLADSTLR